MTFQITPEVALSLLEQARGWGVLSHGRMGDADDGDTPNCLAGLQAPRERYVVGVRAACRIHPQRTATGPVQRAGRGQPEERQDSWSNLPAAATSEALAGYAHGRLAVELFHAEATGEVGWNH